MNYVLLGCLLLGKDDTWELKINMGEKSAQLTTVVGFNFYSLKAMLLAALGNLNDNVINSA